MPEMIECQGQQVAAERVAVVSASEDWNTYLLDDGTTLQNKAVLVHVWRLCDQRRVDGGPVYVYRTENVAGVIEAQPVVAKEPLDA